MTEEFVIPTECQDAVPDRRARVLLRIVPGGINTRNNTQAKEVNTLFEARVTDPRAQHFVNLCSIHRRR
jgi:hypothetical protein